MKVFDSDCKQCPRLAQFLKEVKQQYPDYFSRPVPAFGDDKARLCIVGLAPGMHGANATGRPFTGDHAGILLYKTLHDFGFSNQPESTSLNDGLQLSGCRITNAGNVGVNIGGVTSAYEEVGNPRITPATGYATVGGGAGEVELPLSAEELDGCRDVHPHLREAALTEGDAGVGAGRQVEHPLELLGRGVQHGLARRDTGVVDQQVEPPVMMTEKSFFTQTKLRMP